ncbi:MAG TPA: CvpA family protein [bacterium]|nr:CvpA family protein [bacterium]
MIFKGLKIVIIILFFIGILIGMGRGFLGTIFDFVSIFVALYAGSFIYLVPVKLLAGFGITGGVAGLICYVCICVCLMFASGILLERIRRKIRMKHFADRFFGGVLGTADGLIFASALMIIMSVSPGKAKEIDKNIFFTGIRNFIPKTYENFERAGITIPKMISLPSSYPQEFKPRNEGMRFTKFNFTRLDGSHCLRCGGIVRFTGYIAYSAAKLTVIPVKLTVIPVKVDTPQ